MEGQNLSSKVAHGPGSAEEGPIGIDTRIFSKIGFAFRSLTLSFIELQNTRTISIIRYEELKNNPGVEGITLILFLPDVPQRFHVQLQHGFILAVRITSSDITHAVEVIDGKNIMLAVDPQNADIVLFKKPVDMNAYMVLDGVLSKVSTGCGKLKMEIRSQDREDLKQLEELLIFKYRVMETKHRQKMTEMHELRVKIADELKKQLDTDGAQTPSRFEARCWEVFIENLRWKGRQALSFLSPKTLEELCHPAMSLVTGNEEEERDTKTQSSDTTIHVSQQETTTDRDRGNIRSLKFCEDYTDVQ
ncbi:hypothetical protein TWF694_005045 [Orbilia ellipsospora]|uniref:Uncharacterized protein n=1 Tax=Orbilia ellipsospora TaxID=2528407 RepID=A0AAV9WW05_9PEZI